MKKLTLVDLMAIYYWKANGYCDDFIAKKLFMSAEQLKDSFVSNELRWAADIVKEQKYYERNKRSRFF